ncbi:MAG: Gfo/Idh/MocA family oxidoreductase, partial [Akkermansiaceae bacterium]|nr:Gfo/Idh/MocA family oxidoreductase [Akkermansiaceae bacterium]
MKYTGAAAATASFPAIAAPGSPGERVRLALVGCGGRGTGLATSFAGRDDVELTHVCDLFDARLEAAGKAIAGRQGGKVPRKLKRVEELLEASDLDGVIVGTPDHWHAPLAIMACQAGKDVYVEKPFSH